MGRLKKRIEIGEQKCYFREEFCQKLRCVTMETRKLLLVDTSVSLCQALAEMLGNAYELRICNNGLQALGELESFRPDVLVVDLFLPGVDGISVLKAAANAKHRPALLVTTRFCGAFIESAVGEIGVDYVMLKPFDLRTLVERIHDLSQCEYSTGAGLLPSVASPLSNILLSLSVPAGRKGFGYLEQLVELYRQDPSRSLTKELYPEVGLANKTNGAGVERAVRGVIQTAWDQRNEALWRMYFTPSRSGMMPRPTNLAFIATLAEVLGREEERQA